jgi:hypothetical protein
MLNSGDGRVGLARREGGTREEVGGEAVGVAVVDVGAAGQAGGGVAVVVAFEGVDEEGDDGGGDEEFHGAKFALVSILPTVAGRTLCVDILPT